MKSLATLSCLLVCLFLIGCKGGGADVVGKWKGSADIPAGKENDPATKMAQQMMGSMALEFKADKTFVLTMMFPFEGTWAQSGSTVTLTMTKVMGQDVSALKKQAEASGKAAGDMDKPMVLTLSADGKTLTGADTTGKGSLKFTREK